MTMFTRRIVVTGLGAVTPVGNDPSTFWQALLDGNSGVQSIGSLAARGARPSYAAEVKDLTPEAAGLPRKRLKMMGRQAQLAFAAVAHASADAGLLDERAVDHRRLGVILGVGMLNADVDELGRAFHAMADGVSNRSFDMIAFGRLGGPQLFPLWLLRHIPNLAAAHASISLDAQGPSNTIATGCVAGANAIGEAARIIARGDADVILAGGTDARTTALAILRYRELGWLATREDVPPGAVSAPFDDSAARASTPSWPRTGRPTMRMTSWRRIPKVAAWRRPCRGVSRAAVSHPQRSTRCLRRPRPFLRSIAQSHPL